MNATHALWLLAVPVVAVGVATAARRAGMPSPLALVAAGLVMALPPGIPEFALDPEFVLFAFLPPLLFSAAWESSLPNLRDSGRAIGYLAVGLVLFTTVTVGYAVYLIVPAMPLPAAFVLGAIVAPPDAVAAVSVAKRLGLPRRVVTVLVGESLFNDATALTAFRVAVAATAGEGFTLLSGGWEFLYAALGGAAIGLAAGPPLLWLRTRLRDPVAENAVAVLAPFAAYLVAEAVHASGVIAVVVSGLYLGHRFARSPASTRVIGQAFWKVTIFILESVVFLLIGLQLPAVMAGLSERSPFSLLWWAATVFGVVVATRFLWVFATARAPHLPLLRRRAAGGRPRRPMWREMTVVSWAGMRGVVSLAAAFAIPTNTAGGAPFPERHLILFLTFTTVLGTLLLQGMTFPALIRRLGVNDEDERRTDAVSEAEAQHIAANAALRRLEALVEQERDRLDERVVRQLRDLVEHRRLSAWERLGGAAGPDGAEVPTGAYRRLRREMLAAEREAFVRMRDERRIDDEVLERVLTELDLEELALSRR